MKTVIISDLHVGSCDSDHKAILSFLLTIECDQLILDGDVWELWDKDADEIKEQHGCIVERIMMLMILGKKVIYTEGNHDNKDPKHPVIVHLQQKKSFEFEDNGKKILVIHGHQFDSFLWRWFQISLFYIGKVFCALLGKPYRYIHKSSKSAAAKLKRQVIEKYQGKYDVVVVGHTHAPEYEKSGSFEFANSGDWKGSNSYIVIEDGVTTLNFFT